MAAASPPALPLSASPPANATAGTSSAAISGTDASNLCSLKSLFSFGCEVSPVNMVTSPLGGSRQVTP